jgi:hypothetical protein
MARPKGTARLGDIPQAFLTGDLSLDLIAMVWKEAFKEADQGDEQARDEIRDFFSYEALDKIYKQRLIQWIP